MEGHAFQRFKLPIFTDGPRDTRNQLLSVGLRLVCYLLRTERIHTTSAPASPVSIALLQNYTMILQNHPTSPRSHMSIIPVRQGRQIPRRYKVHGYGSQ